MGSRSKGLAVGDLQVREMDGGRYAVAVVRQEGRPAPAVLSETLTNVIAGLRFDKSMRWNSSNADFSRPIRWLLALFGDQVVSFAYAGISSGNITRGLRFNDPAEFSVKIPQDYLAHLAAQGIIIDTAERRQRIQSQIEALAGGGRRLKPIPTCSPA
jgi:glycyl-tRNA synthetase